MGLEMWAFIPAFLLSRSSSELTSLSSATDARALILAHRLSNVLHKEQSSRKRAALELKRHDGHVAVLSPLLHTVGEAVDAVLIDKMVANGANGRRNRCSPYLGGHRNRPSTIPSGLSRSAAR